MASYLACALQRGAHQLVEQYQIVLVFSHPCAVVLKRYIGFKARLQHVEFRNVAACMAQAVAEIDGLHVFGCMQADECHFPCQQCVDVGNGGFGSKVLGKALQPGLGGVEIVACGADARGPFAEGDAFAQFETEGFAHGNVPVAVVAVLGREGGVGESLGSSEVGLCNRTVKLRGGVVEVALHHAVDESGVGQLLGGNRQAADD